MVRVGDWVVVTSKQYGHHFRIGEIVQVVESCGDMWYTGDEVYKCVGHEDNIRDFWYLSKTEFKVLQ